MRSSRVKIRASYGTSMNGAPVSCLATSEGRLRTIAETADNRLPWPHGAKSQIIGSQSQDPSVVFLYVLPHLRGKSF